MKIRHYVIGGLLVSGFAPLAWAQTPAIGWLEHVQLNPHKLVLQAKIDTGADNSSVHADNIHVYEANGVKMVKFTVINKSGARADYDLPLVRYAKIKRKGAEPQIRPVISMELCIGNSLKAVNLNLANRENFKYRMLIGRSYLKDQYLVDSAKQYTAEPNCQAQTLSQKASY